MPGNDPDTMPDPIVPALNEAAAIPFLPTACRGAACPDLHRKMPETSR
jgi:hypothetical protein